MIRPRSVFHAFNWSSLGAGAALLGTAAVILAASGVTLVQASIAACYELTFVLLPGYAAYRILLTDTGHLSRRLTFAWGLGYTIEVIAFAITAALRQRWLFSGLPLIAIVALASRRRTCQSLEHARRQVSPRVAWTFAAISSLGLAYLWLTYFLDNPLPGTVPVVSYYVDTVHDLALAAEALHHWPMTDPHVHGEAFGYYLFPFMHMAAVSQVTGLELPLIVFRLFIVPSFIALSVQAYYLGTVAGNGSRLAGLVSAACVLLIGELDLSRAEMYPFYNIFFLGLIYSPTFLLGLVVFIPFAAAVATRQEERFDARRFIALFLLLVGCAGTKGQVVPMLCAALAAFVGWVAIRERRFEGSTFLLAVAAGALVVAVYAFAQQRTTSISFHPLARTPTATTLPGPIPWVLGFAGLVGIRAIGLLGSIPAVWRRASSGTTWLALLASAGIVPTYLFDMGSGEFYFLSFAYVVLSALTGAVMATMWAHQHARIGVMATWIAVGLGIIGLCDLPLDYADRLRRYAAGEAVYATTNNNLTRGLWDGLVWARDHLPPGAVLAVNNQSIGGDGDWRYFYYSAFAERHTFLEGWLYSNQTHALGYDAASAGAVQPFPDRLALNKEVFGIGSSRAIAELRAQGVTHLLVDKVHGRGPDALNVLGTRVFSNRDIDIYAIGAPH